MGIRTARTAIWSVSCGGSQYELSLSVQAWAIPLVASTHYCKACSRGHQSFSAGHLAKGTPQSAQQMLAKAGHLHTIKLWVDTQSYANGVLASDTR